MFRANARVAASAGDEENLQGRTAYIQGEIAREAQGLYAAKQERVSPLQ
jgi:hypothetical protein